MLLLLVIIGYLDFVRIFVSDTFNIVTRPVTMPRHSGVSRNPVPVPNLDPGLRRDDVCLGGKNAMCFGNAQ